MTLCTLFSNYIKRGRKYRQYLEEQKKGAAIIAIIGKLGEWCVCVSNWEEGGGGLMIVNAYQDFSYAFTDFINVQSHVH